MCVVLRLEKRESVSPLVCDVVWAWDNPCEERHVTAVHLLDVNMSTRLTLTACKTVKSKKKNPTLLPKSHF